MQMLVSTARGGLKEHRKFAKSCASRCTLPASAEGGDVQTGDVPILVRVTDDSGNAGTGTAMLRRRHSSSEQRRTRDEL